MKEPVTERVGRYQLLDPIGTGPCGVVSRAKVFGVAGFERQFAIKRFHPELTVTAALAQALSAGARAYGSLEHPRIARMSEFGVAQGQTFTAVEYVAGLDALRLVAEARLAGVTLAAGGALALVSQAARAVGYAHGRGLTHLGLAPTNVIVTSDGDVKITDFGILAAGLPQRPIEVARLAQRVHYLAPEQLANEATSAATDVFSLGVIAYELVTGQRTFKGETAQQIAQSIMSGAPPEPALPRPIVRVLQRCLARSPFERFPDARALADALDAALRVAPVPGTRKDIGAQVAATLDRLAALRESEMSGMVALNLGTGPVRSRLEAPAQVSTLGADDRELRADTTQDATPASQPRGSEPPPPASEAPKTILGLPTPPIPVPPGVTPPPPGPRPGGWSSSPGTKPPATIPVIKPRFEPPRMPPGAPKAAEPPSRPTPLPSGLNARSVPPPAPKPNPALAQTMLATPTPTPPRPPELPELDSGLLETSPNVAPPADLDRQEVTTGIMPAVLVQQLNDTIVEEKETSEIAGFAEQAKQAELAAASADDRQAIRDMKRERAALARQLNEELAAVGVDPLGRPREPSPSSPPANVASPSTIPPPTMVAPARAPARTTEPPVTTQPPAPSSAGRGVAIAAAIIVGGVGIGFGAWRMFGNQDSPQPVVTVTDDAATPVAVEPTGEGLADATETAIVPSDAPTVVAATPVDARQAAPIDAAQPAAPPVDAGAPIAATEASDALVITSKPRGARVYLDGADVGVTPLNQPGSADRHTVALLLAGHDLYQGQIAGHGKFVIALKEVTPPGGPAGIKVIKCKDKERHYVFVDGKPTGQMCPTERINTTLGPHTVEVYDAEKESRTKWDIDVKETRLSHRVKIE
ncbi:MAG: protein kinase [Kofleriaceae bacterium]